MMATEETLWSWPKTCNTATLLNNIPPRAIKPVYTRFHHGILNSTATLNTLSFTINLIKNLDLHKKGTSTNKIIHNK